MEIVAAFLLLINQDRLANGVPAISQCTVMQDFANQRANQQQAWNVLSHKYSNGMLAIYTQFDKFSYVGENLAGENGPINPVQVESALMNSPTHRANILEPKFSCVDIGINTDGTIISQEFGGP